MQDASAFARRPIRARNSRWAAALASLLAGRGIAPNTISCASVVFAALAGAAFLALRIAPSPYAQAALFVVAIGGIQGRLVCNLLDGMVAIEGGKSSPVGALYNEFPDRVSDSLLLVPIGYAAGVPWLGWLAALLAALTAYVRVFGGALRQAQDFGGVMAKQRRMAVLTVGLVVQAVETIAFGTRYALLATAIVIAAGSLVTCITRTRGIAARLGAA
jgi:phosphatidylglycerophosphate synthase